MSLTRINRTLAWSVLIAGVVLSVASGALVLIADAPRALLVTLFAAVAAQVGKVSLREDVPATATRTDRTVEPIAA